jgi:hypothetical protein
VRPPTAGTARAGPDGEGWDLEAAIEVEGYGGGRRRAPGASIRPREQPRPTRLLPPPLCAWRSPVPAGPAPPRSSICRSARLAASSPGPGASPGRPPADGWRRRSNRCSCECRSQCSRRQPSSYCGRCRCDACGRCRTRPGRRRAVDGAAGGGCTPVSHSPLSLVRPEAVARLAPLRAWRCHIGSDLVSILEKSNPAVPPPLTHARLHGMLGAPSLLVTGLELQRQP